MKKLTVILLIMMFILTVFVACKEEKTVESPNSKPSSWENGTVNADSSSTQSLSSEQEELWGDISISVGSEDTGNSSLQSSGDKTESTSSSTVSSNTSSSSVGSALSSATPDTSSNVTSSYDKDQGYESWVSFPKK